MTDGHIGTEEAADILGCNERTVRRYSEKGFLNCIDGPKKLYHKSAIASLKESIDFFADNPEIIKAAYVIYSSGMLENAEWYNKELLKKKAKDTGNKGLHDIRFIGNPDYQWNIEKITDHLSFYGRKRRNELSQYTDKPWDFYTVEESAARLDIGNYHAVYGMLEDKLIDSEEFKTGKRKKNLITKSSFDSYLGNDKGQMFYGSDLASALTGKTINEIDRIAKEKNIGRKLNPYRRNSRYLFTFDELMRFNGFKKSNGNGYANGNGYHNGNGYSSNNGCC